MHGHMGTAYMMHWGALDYVSGPLKVREQSCLPKPSANMQENRFENGCLHVCPLLGELPRENVSLQPDISLTQHLSRRREPSSPCSHLSMPEL